MRLLAAILVATTLAVSCDAGSRCVWGPSYWCQSSDTAKECGKESYCQRSVWTVKKEGGITGGIECDTCKLIVRNVEKLVESNSTEDEVKMAVEKVCVYLGPLAGKCRDLMDENFDMIWKLVFNELDAQKICELVKMCPPSQPQKQFLSVGKVSVKSDACDICKTVTAFLKNFVDGSSSEDEVKSALEDFCKVLPASVSSDCTSLVDEYFGLIWNLVKAEVDGGQICTMIGVCNSTSSSTQTKHLKLHGVKASACDICKLAVSFLEKYVDDNSTEAEVKAAVEQLCKLLPGSASTDCTNLIESNFDAIWKLIQEEVDSGEICQQIGLCNSTLSTPLKLEKVSVKQNLCDICKLAVSFLKRYVDDNSTEAEVKAALEQVCNLLPASIKSECSTVVDQYFDQIWKLIQEEVDDNDICKMIGLCNTTLSVPLKVEKVSVKQNLCDICKLAVQFLEPYVDSNSTEAQVKGALEQLCGILPASLKSECTSLIDSNFDMIWELLQSEVDNDLICKQLNLCNSTLSKMTSLRVGSDGCDICKTIINFLALVVSENSTQQEVKDALEKFCGLIKSSQCTSLVTEYFGVVWQLIKGEVDNDEFCKQTNLCPSSFPRVLVQVKDSGLCDICKVAVPFLRKYIDSNETEIVAKAALESLCQEVPAALQGECTQLVDNYFPMLWKLLQSYVDDDKICQELKLCSANSTLQKVSPLTSAGCTICERIMKEVESLVTSKSSEAEIKAALEEACTVLPSFLRSECKEFVDDYADEIVGLIIKGLDPQAVCTALGLCSKTVQLSAPKDSIGCVICELVLKEVDSILQGNTSEAAIEAALDKVCDILPKTVQSVCEGFVKQYAPEILQLLVNGLNPQEVCTKIGLCNSTLSLPKDSIGCVICELVLKEVDSILQGNTSDAAIEAALDKVCDILPKTVQSVCEGFVKQYAPEILQLLVNGLNPQEVCTKIGLCNSTLSLVSLPIKGGPLCVICEYVIKELDSMLDGNTSKAAVEDALDKVCSIMPSSVRSDCTSFVDKYTDKIMDLILDGVAPKAICTLLHLCVLPKQPATTLLKNPKSVSECEVCKVTLSTVKTLIDSGVAKTTVEDALKKACSLLPTEIIGECKTFVTNYADQVIQLVDQEIDPEKLCKDVGLCKNSVKATKVLMQPWLKMTRAREL